MPLLVLIFFVLPIVELTIVVKVAGSLGIFQTIGMLILVSLVGAFLVKREGLAAYRRAQDEMAAGRVPSRELVDGVMILVGGAFLLTPGFLTDALGLSLLLPPVRAALRSFATKAMKGRMTVVAPGFRAARTTWDGFHERRRDDGGPDFPGPEPTEIDPGPGR